MPAGVVAAVGIVIAASAVASAAAAPSLPAKTAAQLLAEVATDGARPLGPLTATVQQTSSLGLPQLPAALQQQDGANTSLMAGTQSVSIWYRDPQHLRIAEPVRAGETDLRLDGRTLWVWSSRTQTATRVALPAHFTGLAGNVATRRALPLTGSAGQHALPPAFLPDSPLAAANQVLRAVGPTTVVSVQRNLYVAGRAAYQLALVPRSSQSLVGRILIAIDASKHIPLRVQVFARGSSSLAYGIGFTALSFGVPAASNFTFTPPPGAIVKRETVPSSPQALLPKGVAGLNLGGPNLGGLNLGGLNRAALGPASFGISSGTHAGIRLRASNGALPERVLTRINAQFAKSLPKSLTAAQRASRIKAFDKFFKSVRAARATGTGGGFINVHGPAVGSGAPKVIGSSWLSVVATPASPQVAAEVKLLLSSHLGPIMGSPAGSSTVQSPGSATAYSSTLTITARPGLPFGPDLALLRMLLTATTPVHGSWGSGRLLQTKLLSVLITSDGRILAGAVTPAVLYRDVALDA